MKRIWVYLKESTFKTAVDALKWWGANNLIKRKSAADDLSRSKKLSDTGATRDEIEHASHKHDEE